MTTGFAHASIAVSNGSSVRRGFSPRTILPNSRISAPAMKVRPAPITTMAFTPGSAAALSMAP